MGTSIGRAIKVISDYIDDPLIINKNEFIEAISLGGEALKHIQDLRYGSPVDPWRKLPGEAQDSEVS